VTELNLQVTTAKTNLAMAAKAKVDALEYLNIQTAAGARLQITEQRKRE